MRLTLFFSKFSRFLCNVSFHAMQNHALRPKFLPLYTIIYTYVFETTNYNLYFYVPICPITPKCRHKNIETFDPYHIFIYVAIEKQKLSKKKRRVKKIVHSNNFTSCSFEFIYFRSEEFGFSRRQKCNILTHIIT